MIEALEANKILENTNVLFSICTLVTDKSEYKKMLDSFRTKGFVAPDTEFLFLDNSSENLFDAFSGCNVFLRAARGEFVILCHQDVVLHDHDIEILKKRIEEISGIDPNWAVLGNAGGKSLGEIVVRITDRHGENTSRGVFPERVQSLDENFLVVRSEANLTLSGNLKGFHLYGTDLCLVASILGYSAYVIDFHLHHKGLGHIGNRGEDPVGFYQVCNNLIEKYGRALAPRYVQTTCTKLFISGSNMLNRIGNTARFKRWATSYYKKTDRR